MQYIARTDIGSILKISKDLKECIDAAKTYRESYLNLPENERYGLGHCKVERKMIVFSTEPGFECELNYIDI